MVRDKLALSFPPLLLRFMLGVVFLYAGYGKIFSDMEIQGEPAAVLANMGAIPGPTPPAVAPPPSPAPAAPAQEPTPTKGETPASPPPSAPDSPLPEAKPGMAGRVLDSDARVTRAAFFERADQANSPTGGESPKSAPPPKPKPAAPHNLSSAATSTPPAAPAPAASVPPAAPGGPKQFTAADFPTPVKARIWTGLALAVYFAAHPATGSPLMPKEWAQGRWPVYLAHAASWTEFVGGILVLVGFLTRLAALGLAGVMAVAVWLVGIGPVVMGPAGTKSFLGFLPALSYDPPGWSTWLFPFSMLITALALFFSRPGALSLDSLLFAQDAAGEAPKA